ncbi:MAG: phage holin family protein [Acidimicrobiales bacterium]
MAIEQAPNPWPQRDLLPKGSRYTSPSPPPSTAPPREPSLGDLFGTFNNDLKTLIEKEMALAKAEVKEQAATATKAGALFGAAAVTGLFMLLLASFAAAWGLAEVMPTGVAFAVVAVVYLVIAGVCFSMARARMRTFRPVPDQALKSLKRDIQVAKDSLTRGMHSPLQESSRR